MSDDLEREWLETDAFGGLASGTVRGARTRRYHALLLTALTPPTGRVALVNGFEAWIETPSRRFALSTQDYLPDVSFPDGDRRIVDFAREPWPTWRFRLEDGSEVTQEIIVLREAACTCLRWRRHGAGAARLILRPLISGRDYHSLHRANPGFDFAAESRGASSVAWRPYSQLPAILATGNGRYTHDPDWYRDFRYEEERRRGLDFVEDLGSPGMFTWSLDADAELVLRAEAGPDGSSRTMVSCAEAFSSEARRRAAFATPLARAASQYIVQRGEGRTIIAGFPWFTDWGRDTFIAMRGLCLATERLDVAGKILLAWAGTVSEGMLPNRFADHQDEAEYNAVDASLWYVVAVGEYLEAFRGRSPPAQVEERLWAAVLAIIDGYRRGTRFGIRMDDDGLIAAGVPGLQLTWMDVKVGDHVVTPRIGKPVEIQALWLNALLVGASRDPELSILRDHGLASFKARFWRPEAGCLYDVVDVDHVPGRVDPAFRPNQIFAVGGLPAPLLGGDQAKRLVEAVEERLLTPMGLRTLAPGEPGFTTLYAGGPRERDMAYHQGTVWPWLIGAFVEAWLRVHGSTPETRAVAKARFLDPLLAHMDRAGLGHVSEVADAMPPHRPGGCPFQAWSLGELLRALQLVA